MSVARQNLTRFSKLKTRSFILAGLLVAGALFFLSRQPNIRPPLFANYTRWLALSFAKLKPQGLAEKLSAGLDSIWLWSQGVYAAGIEPSGWLINRWLALAVIMGTLIPTIVLGLFFIIRGIRDYFEKQAIANKYLLEVVKSIKGRVSRAYRRSVLRSWEQASLIILSLGIGLLCLQLLAANLWWWNRGVGISSLFLFILYAHWVYYDRLLRQEGTKRRLLSQIDSRLGLKQGLVTLMDTQNFNTSPRLYKLLLGEVFYRIKPTNFTNILSYKFSWSAKRELALPLLLIIGLSGLASAAYSRLALPPEIRDKLGHFFSLENEPKSIEQLLVQEADSLRLLTTELQHNQADEPEMAYIIDNLNELTAEFTYLAGAPLNIGQNNQAGDAQETEAGRSNKPLVKRRAINWDENTAARGSKGNKKPNTPDIGQKTPVSIPPDWPDVSPPDAGTTNPLRTSGKYYQAISAEVNKVAQAMLALKLDREDAPGKGDEQQLTLDEGLGGAFSLADQLANGVAGSDTESFQSDTENRESQSNKSDTSRGQSSQQKPKDSPAAENSAAQAPILQPIVKALEQIGSQLSTIKLYDAGAGVNDQAQGKTRPTGQSPTQGEVVNRIQLKPIKTKAEPKPAAPPQGVVALDRPHQLEIDFNTDKPHSAAVSKDQRFPLPQQPPNNLNQKIKVSARRIEELGNRLLMVNNPEQISFNPQQGEAISSIWKGVRASIKTPKDIDNQLPQVTERIQGVDDPRQIAAITSELAELKRSFSTWGKDSGNKLSRLRPDLAQLAETDSLGRMVSKPLPEGGPDKADRQAVIIRGKRKQASQHSGDLERIRVEEHPEHLPTNDITANVSLELTQVANRLENIDVASIKANMSGMNLRNFVIEKQRTLEILNNQLARAKDFSSVTQVTNKLADLSAQLGKLALDSQRSAKFLANQQARPEGQRFGQDTVNRQLMKKVARDGEKLLELSRQIKQEVGNESRESAASQMLALAKGLTEADFDQLMLNDYNKLRLDNLLRNLSQQLRKVDQNTTDLADVDRNSYAVAAIASRLERLGAGGIDFTAVSEGKDRVDLTQLASQLSNLSQQMQSAARQSPGLSQQMQSATRQSSGFSPKTQSAAQAFTNPDQLNQPQSGRDQELMQAIADGKERLGQISERLEAAENREQRKELGLELLELSRRLKDRAAEDSNNPLKTVSTKAIMSLGDQVKQVGRQLRFSPADYQPISQHLQQIAARLEERRQELTAAQLASDQDMARLSADLSSLAQRLAKIGPDALRQQDRLRKQAEQQIKADMEQRVASQATQDLFKVSQDLADLSDNPVAEYADQLGGMIDKLKLNDGSKQLDQSAVKGLRRELLQLSQGLTQSRLEPESMAAAEGLPEIAGELAELSQKLTDKRLNSGQLASQLTEIYAELNQLDLARDAGELALTKDLGTRLKQISNNLRKLPFARRQEITSTLDRLGNELSTANMPANKAASYRHLSAERKGALTEPTAAASRRKKKMALKNIDQAVERLKRQQRKTKGRYNPERSSQRLSLAAKGIAGTNKGVMSKLKDSAHNRTNFAANEVAKQIDVTPEKETISNVYPMERNLTERDVFSRIIKRLEDKRERISRFGTPTAVKPTVSRRTGDLNQPQNLDYEGRMLTMTGRKSDPITTTQEQKTAFLEKPESYNRIEDITPYAYQSPVSPKDIDANNLSDLPLEKQEPKLKIQSNLKLHAEQAQDKASQGQLIPASYREIIRKLYLR